MTNERFQRWYACSLCEQRYHGVVRCALGWACWKTYLGRPETAWIRAAAMTALGNGLTEAGQYEDALSVQEAELAMKRRLRAIEDEILTAQGNLAISYGVLERHERALQIKRDVYSGWLRLKGEENENTLQSANSHAVSLNDLDRFEEARSVLRKTMPVARRVLGESHELTQEMRSTYAVSLYKDPSTTLDGLREAVTTLEDVGRIARRVLGGAHPVTEEIEGDLENARAELRAREAEAVRVAECDALQRDLDATQARIAALNARKAEAIGKLTPPGDA